MLTIRMVASAKVVITVQWIPTTGSTIADCFFYSDVSTFIT